VTTVQVRRGAQGDEELRAVGAGPGVGHGQQVRAVEREVGVELVAELVAGAAAAGAGGVAALDHEAVDDAVENDAVIEVAGDHVAGVVAVFLRACGQPGEVGDGLGGLGVEQVQRDVAVVGVQNGFHVVLLSSVPSRNGSPWGGARASGAQNVHPG